MNGTHLFEFFGQTLNSVLFLTVMPPSEGLDGGAESAVGNKSPFQLHLQLEGLVETGLY